MVCTWPLAGSQRKIEWNSSLMGEITSNELIFPQAYTFMPCFSLPNAPDSEAPDSEADMNSSIIAIHC